MYLVDIGSGFDHLYFRDVIRPSRVSQKFCDLTTQIEDFVEQRSVDGQSVIVPFVGFSASLWVLREFELEKPEPRS